MTILLEYGVFLLKLITVAAIFFVILAAVVGGRDKQKTSRLRVTKLNERYEQMQMTLDTALLSKKQLKEKQKQAKLSAKQALKDAKLTDKITKKRVFVMDFDGDINASAVSQMRKEITAILSVASSNDEVVLRLESGGGVVHGYGLAASQLLRLKPSKIPLTICVDKVAASGGYMMACVADKIIAAPFAIVGSIGVVAQIPNIHRLLDKNLIDVELHTAGKYKRTLTVLGENTEEGREKFKQDLQDTHNLFKDFVAENRPKVDIDAIATGDIWYGSQALTKALIDQVSTSDDYITAQLAHADIIHIAYEKPKKMAEKLGLSVFTALEKKATQWLTHLLNHRGY